MLPPPDKSDAGPERATCLILEPPFQWVFKGFDNVDANAADCSCIPAADA